MILRWCNSADKPPRMHGRFICASFAALCLLGVPAHAERSWHVGWLGGIGQPTIADPDGPTKVGSQTLWKDLVITYERDRDNRLFFQVADQSYSLDASSTNIGQDVSRTTGLLSYQTRFRLTRTFKPWFGIGLGYASEKYAPRFTVTNTGFLQQRFADRSESGIAATINATSEWAFLYGTNAGIHLQYEHGLGDLSRLTSLSFFISY